MGGYLPGVIRGVMGGLLHARCYIYTLQDWVYAHIMVRTDRHGMYEKIIKEEV